MVYKIEVKDNGEIFMTKIKNIPTYNVHLIVDTLDVVCKELEGYGVAEIVQDIKDIEAAKINEEVQCY